MNEDALVKVGLEALLQPFVEVRSQHEVQPAAQFVDVFVASEITDPEAMWRALGWLGRMASSLAMLEAFTSPVSEQDARDCLRKQLTLHHTMGLQARAQQQPGAARLEVPLPDLWLLTWNQPRKLLSSWGMTPVEGWPAGCYRAAPGFKVGVVVLPELPRVRDTLPLRLFGQGETRLGLRAEYDALAVDDPMRQTVGARLVCWTMWLRGQPEDQELKGWLMTFQQVVQSELSKTKAEGKTEGLRTAVTDLSEVFGLELTPARRAHLASLDEAGLEQLRQHLKQHRAWPS